MSLHLDVVFKSFNEQMAGQEKARQRNVQKLIDYYNGQQIEYLKPYLKFDKELDDFPFYYTNITKKIMKKLAR